MSIFGRLHTLTPAGRSASQSIGAKVQAEAVSREKPASMADARPFLGSPSESSIGRRFGRLHVIGYCGRFNRRAIWLCRCQCGTLCKRPRSDLVDVDTTMCADCDHLRRLKLATRSTPFGRDMSVLLGPNEILSDTRLPVQPFIGPPGQDLTDMRVGRLTVIGAFHGGSKWQVRCDCGSYTVRKRSYLCDPEIDDTRAVCGRCDTREQRLLGLNPKQETDRP